MTEDLKPPKLSTRAFLAMSAALGAVVDTLNPIPKGERRQTRRARQREAIESSPRTNIPIDPNAKGFAPWSEERLRVRRVMREFRIWSKRKRNPARGAHARKVLKTLGDAKAAKS